MAARNRPGLSEATRKRIQTTQLVHRLEAHINGNVELSNSQIRAIEILLRKTLPDLSAVEYTGEVKTTLTDLLVMAKEARDRAEAQDNPEIRH